MKRTLILAAILTLPTLGMADDKTLPQKASDAAASVAHGTKDAAVSVEHGTKDAADAVVNGAKNAWNSTKAYITQDPNEFREGAERKLRELTEEIDQLKSDSKSGIGSREYFATRVKSLREHLAFARNELRKLSEDKKEFPDARKRLNNTMDGLEGAVGEAEKEARAGK